MLFLLVNSDDLSHLWKIAWKLKILLKEAWNVDDTTYTSELQNVTIILPFMSKVFDNINVQKCFKVARVLNGELGEARLDVGLLDRTSLPLVMPALVIGKGRENHCAQLPREEECTSVQ